MRIALVIALGIAFCALPAPAEEAAEKPTLTWDYEGYSSLVYAAAKAEKTKRRILVGMSGGAT